MIYTLYIPDKHQQKKIVALLKKAKKLSGMNYYRVIVKSVEIYITKLERGKV